MSNWQASEKQKDARIAKPETSAWKRKTSGEGTEVHNLKSQNDSLQQEPEIVTGAMNENDKRLAAIEKEQHAHVAVFDCLCGVIVAIEQTGNELMSEIWRIINYSDISKELPRS